MVLMASFFIKVSSTHGKWVYGILAVLTLIAAWQIRLIQIDTDPENMLPEEHEHVRSFFIQRFNIPETKLVTDVEKQL